MEGFSEDEMLEMVEEMSLEELREVLLDEGVSQEVSPISPPHISSPTHISEEAQPMFPRLGHCSACGLTVLHANMPLRPRSSPRTRTPRPCATACEH